MKYYVFHRPIDWKEMNFPTWSDDWKRFETNSKAIAFLFLPSNGDGLEKIRQPTFQNIIQKMKIK